MVAAEGSQGPLSREELVEAQLGRHDLMALQRASFFGPIFLNEGLVELKVVTNVCSRTCPPTL